MTPAERRLTTAGRRRPAERDGEDGADEGAGTVLALALVAVVCSLLLACLGIGAAIVGRHRAAAAADLAALAAADRSVGRSSGPPCSAAARVAEANDAELVSCAVAGDGSVTVTTEVALPAPWSAIGAAQARARAGRESASRS